MAQDSNVRPVRSDESYSREPAADSRNNDPLAELARLIGQDDPFAAVGRPGASAQTPAQAHDPHAPEWLNRSAPAPQHGHYDDADQHDAAAYDAQYQHQHDDQTQYAADEYYDDGQTYGDEGYDEPAPQKRRGGLTIVAAVVGLAVLGTAGVYGYRAFTGPATTSGEPPVIKAEQTPMKVVPPAPTNDSQVAKPYVPGNDRGGERVVPREEQPVDPRSIAKVNPPAPPAASSVLPPLAAPAPQPAAGAGTEPRKVKTVAIRPDQQQAAAGPAPMRVTPTPAPAPAVATPAPRPVAAVPVQSTPAANAPGHYVQVSSQMNEPDALASFKALQAKYPGQLGDHQPVIRRVDLSDKGIGIRYRAMVGPFSTSSEAKQFCESFKAAGGKCIANPS